MTPPVQPAEAAHLLGVPALRKESAVKTIEPKLDRLAIWTLDETAAYLRESRRKFDETRRREGFPRPLVTSDGGFPKYRACDVMDWCARLVAA